MRRSDCGAATLLIYERRCDKLNRWILEHHPNMTELRDITPEVVNEFAADLTDQLQPSTFNHHVIFFRCLWKTLKKEARLVGDNPWDEIQEKTLVVHSRRELTIEELKRVCASLKGEMRILFAIGIYTGLRYRTATGRLRHTEMGERRPRAAVHFADTGQDGTPRYTCEDTDPSHSGNNALRDT